jgi:hypothetical protein
LGAPAALRDGDSAASASAQNSNTARRYPSRLHPRPAIVRTRRTSSIHYASHSPQSRRIANAPANGLVQLAQTRTGSDGRFEITSQDTLSADVSLYLVAKGGEAVSAIYSRFVGATMSMTRMVWLAVLTFFASVTVGGTASAQQRASVRIDGQVQAGGQATNID